MWEYGIECPICGQTNSSCRRTDDLYFCRNSDIIDTETFKYVGLSSIGFGMFVPRDFYSETTNYQTYHSTSTKATEGKKLSPLQHDKLNRLLIDTQGLSYHHDLSLFKRGLSKSQIKLIRPYLTSVEFGLDLGIVCAGTDADGVWQSSTGMYILVQDVEGSLLPGQIRLDKTINKTKYLFTSKNSFLSKRNQFDEIPMQVVTFAEEPRAIIITEGLLKPLIAASIHREFLFVGLSGGNISKKTMQYTFECLDERYGGIPILLAGDSGSAHNKFVVNAYEKIVEYLKMLGMDCLLVSWGQYGGKDKRDIDEISSATLLSAIFGEV